jgi:phosphoenolpyruvate carboxykinase (ATP)
MFGTVLENVIIDSDSRRIDLNDGTLTENTRAAYPLASIRNHVPSGMAGHPQNIMLLTCDAFGVLPPIARLTADQAMYHFLSGYTAKVAGTERGVGSEPQITFSTCFGAPFMPLPATVYANMLGEKIAHHGSRVWLVNTGWTGGPFGTGSRMKIAHTRAMIHAALSGALDAAPTVEDPVFGLHVPTRCPDVPAEILNPQATWGDKSQYNTKARELAEKFTKNFEQFADAVTEGVRGAGPR